jgi:hypothetical protein
VQSPGSLQSLAGLLLALLLVGYLRSKQTRQHDPWEKGDGL